jgi:hypothetical protein
MRAVRFFVIVFAVATGGIVASCNDTLSDEPCTGIPEGGCPLSHGVACDDPECKAAYACRSGNVWQLDHTCPPRDAEVFDSFVPDADAGRAFDANIDAPPGAFGGPGCNPLEQPDCELGLVLLCQSGCCDCEDLFVCQNGGWQPWGTCSDGGVTQH